MQKNSLQYQAMDLSLTCGAGSRLHLLVVDADSAVRSACAELPRASAYAVESTGDLGQARSQMRGSGGHPAANLPAGSNQGLEMVSEIKLPIRIPR